MTPKCGFFVTIEGIEGAGKSTLAEALRERLSCDGREVTVTREPGGTRIGDSIRELLLGSNGEMSERTELLLFEAARAQHVAEVIRPAIERGAVVICDRFADSSLAYQASARGIAREAVESLNEFASHGIRPDLTILLDLPADVGLGRQRAVDRISAEGLAFHEAVREGYLKIAEKEKARVVVIDATRSLDEVLQTALAKIEVAK